MDSGLVMRWVSRRVVPGVAVLLLASACASGGAASASSSGTTAATRRTHGSQYVLTAEDLAKVKTDNLYDAIQRLRPNFLRASGGTTISGGSGSQEDASGATFGAVPVRVYLDDVRLDGLDRLKQIPLSQVKEVKYVPGPEAGVRYGTDHSGGVILVTSK